jgi:hypothetical protein
VCVCVWSAPVAPGCICTYMKYDIHACIHPHIQTYTHTHTHTHTHTQIHSLNRWTHEYIHMYTYILIYIYICTHAYTYVHKYAYIEIYRCWLRLRAACMKICMHKSTLNPQCKTLNLIKTKPYTRNLTPHALRRCRRLLVVQHPWPYAASCKWSPDARRAAGSVSTSVA